MLEQEKRWLLEEKYGGGKCEAFSADVEKLKDGMPVAYLIGNMPFLNCVIDLKYKPLIPRPETEFWVNEFIKNEIHKNQQYKILDLFSGSGCIGIVILKNCPNCSVDFGEKNPQFIKQIKKNLRLNKIDKKKYQIFQTDVFSNISENKKYKVNNETRESTLKYDYILTNPPYISENRKNTVQKSVLENENHNSLFASDNGLFFIKKIITEGFNYLKPHGKIYIEFDPWQTDLIKKYLQNKNIKYKFQKDQYNKIRILILYS